MKKHLLIGGAIALCLVGVMFVAQADHVRIERGTGREYIKEHDAIVPGTLNKIFGTGHNKRIYLDEQGRNGRYEEDSRRDYDYRGYNNR